MPCLDCAAILHDKIEMNILADSVASDAVLFMRSPRHMARAQPRWGSSFLSKLSKTARVQRALYAPWSQPCNLDRSCGYRTRVPTGLRILSTPNSPCWREAQLAQDSALATSAKLPNLNMTSIDFSSLDAR